MNFMPFFTKYNKSVFTETSGSTLIAVVQSTQPKFTVKIKNYVMQETKFAPISACVRTRWVSLQRSPGHVAGSGKCRGKGKGKGRRPGGARDLKGGRWIDRGQWEDRRGGHRGGRWKAERRRRRNGEERGNLAPMVISKIRCLCYPPL